MNNRRKLVMLLGAGALAAPLISFAQQQLAKVRSGSHTAAGSLEKLLLGLISSQRGYDGLARTYSAIPWFPLDFDQFKTSD